MTAPASGSGEDDRGGKDGGRPDGGAHLPDADKGAAAEPRAEKPGAAERDAAAQDVARPVAASPEATEPREHMPGDDKPDTAQPGTVRSDAAEIVARLLARAGAGDGAAAAALLYRMVPRLMAFCLRMTGGDRAQAEDVMQEAFLRLWKRVGDWNAVGAARLSSWLRRVAANLAVDAKRRTRRMRQLGDGVEVADGAPWQWRA